MPKTLLHLLAVVLLAVAIPVQGMAAIMAGQCMAFGHHQDGGGHGNAHDQDGANGHDHAGHSHSDQGAAPQADEEANSHCGPCTACCASASIEGPAGIAILHSPSNTKYLFSQLPPPGVQPDGFDRPPLAL